MTVCVFDYPLWAISYPELAQCVQPAQAQAYFEMAGLYLDNTDGSFVCDAAQRLPLLNMLVAHIAALNAKGAGGNGLVGPIEEATEGSVTVKVKLPDSRGLEFWYLQTPYGAAYWAATAQYRTMQYVPAQQPYFGPGPVGFGQGWGLNSGPWRGW